MILISNDFLHKRKINNFEPYDVLLSIATNIPVLILQICFVLQGHNKYIYIYIGHFCIDFIPSIYTFKIY